MKFAESLLIAIILIGAIWGVAQLGVVILSHLNPTACTWVLNTVFVLCVATCVHCARS